MRVFSLLVGVLVVAGLSGCAGTGSEAAAPSRVASDFEEALAGGDGGAACALLAPQTHRDVEEQAGTPCAEAMAGFASDGGPVAAAKTYGHSAQVTVGGDTVFLALLPDGWRVTAALCAPVPDRPYDCDVKGG
jgi:hypothetical protein